MHLSTHTWDCERYRGLAACIFYGLKDTAGDMEIQNCLA